MLVSLSRVKPITSQAFVKVLALAAYSDTEDFIFTPEIRTSLPSWVKTGGIFVQMFDLDKDNWTAMSNGLLKSKPISEDQDTLDAAFYFAEDLRKAVRESIGNENAVGREALAIIKDFCTVALSNKPDTRNKALSRIEKNVGYLQDTSLASLFQAEIENQDAAKSKAEKLAKKMGGEGVNIDAEARKKYKGTATLKEFNAAKRSLNAVPKNFIMNLVRSSGEPYLPVHDVLHSLKEAGIKVHTVPEGFDGMIDDNMRYYTTAGKLLAGSPTGEIHMNPEYDPKKDNSFVCEYKAQMAQNFSYLYTTSYKARRTKAKFEKVAQFDKKFDSLRKKWLRDFKADGITTQKGVFAMLAELVYQTSGRIGSTAGKTDGKTTYGISTLLVGHYKLRGKDRLLEYSGKKAQIQKHKLMTSNPNQKLIIEALDEMAKGKVRKDRLITFKGRGVTGSGLNKYLKSIGLPSGVTVHKFRTMRGTVLAKKILEKNPFKNRTRQPKATVVNKWLKTALEKVAKELGHFSNGKITVATAIANYIDPVILGDFYNEVGIRMPVTIEKQVNLVK